jgi:hypothetical protein
MPVRESSGSAIRTMGRAGLTAAKMADCRWLKPPLVGQFEFVKWAHRTIICAIHDSLHSVTTRFRVL